MNKKEETVKTYNKSAVALAKKFSTIGRRIDDIKRGLSYINEKNPNVLEIGCGNGRDAKEILDLTDTYTGVDISEGMIKIAREHIPKGNFIVADIETFDFPKNIDIIFAFASLLHLDKESIKKVLLKGHSSLNKNGIFYISIKWDRYQEKIQNDEFGQRVFYYYTEEDMRGLALDTNYKIIYEDRQLLRGVDWLTIVLKKD
jgi:predicted TPR repeat methyltransferase